MRVAQYGQWDGYPEGQGATCCEFIESTNMDGFREAVREVQPLSSERLQQHWIDAGADPDDEFVNMEVAERFKDNHPHLSCDTGAKILQMVMEGVREAKLDADFAYDSLFCEWAYVLDLDSEVLEVYRGFQKEPHESGRFFGGETVERENKYYPIRCDHKIPFSEIKAKGVDSLLDLYKEQAATES